MATGRALHGARAVIDRAGFRLPQAFKNGVLLWRPDEGQYSHHHFMQLDEIRHVVEAVRRQGVTPFLSTLEPGNVHRIYHPPGLSSVETKLASLFRTREGIEVRPASALPADAEITSISALGPRARIDAVAAAVADEPELVAYAGAAFDGPGLGWIDIHHHAGTKGNAVEALRTELGASRVLVFGDGDNDLSMFATADESYAPDNAATHVKAAATAVIGRHDEDGIARFLRERFALGQSSASSGGSSRIGPTVSRQARPR